MPATRMSATRPITSACHDKVAGCCSVDLECDDGDVCTDNQCTAAHVCSFPLKANCCTPTSPGSGDPCDEPVSPYDKAPCKAGHKVCIANEWICEGAVKPQPEVCDWVDNDCDGNIDAPNACPTTSTCVNGYCAKPCGSGEFPCGQGGLVCKGGLCIPASCDQPDYPVICPSGLVCVEGECVFLDGGLEGGKGGSGGTAGSGGTGGADASTGGSGGRDMVRRRHGCEQGRQRGRSDRRGRGERRDHGAQRELRADHGRRRLRMRHCGAQRLGGNGAVVDSGPGCALPTAPSGLRRCAMKRSIMRHGAIAAVLASAVGLAGCSDDAYCYTCGQALEGPSEEAGLDSGTDAIVLDSGDAAETSSLTCPEGWGDCNLILLDKCETNLNTDPMHCGDCQTVCVLAHATAKCEAGKCAIKACDQNFEDCDKDPSNGCEGDLMNDPLTCGTCDNSCDVMPNSTPVCEVGVCTKFTCNKGFENCNEHGERRLRDQSADRRQELRELLVGMRDQAPCEARVRRGRVRARGLRQRVRRLRPKRVGRLRIAAVVGQEQLQRVRDHVRDPRPCDRQVRGLGVRGRQVRAGLRGLQRRAHGRLRDGPGERSAELRGVRAAVS